MSLTSPSARRRLVWCSIPVAAALALTACTQAEVAPPAESSASASTGLAPEEVALHGKVTKTVGPNGASGVGTDQLALTDADIAQLKTADFSAALLLQTNSAWADAVTKGARERLEQLGIRLSATSNSAYSAADQANAVKTVLADKPSAILAWPINPAELAPSLRQAAQAGSKLAFISNIPDGFQHGTDYIGVVGDDLYGMGKVTADGLAAAIGGAGDIGYIYFSANAYVVNQRDAAFRTVIENDYPNIRIAATQGFSDPSQVFEVARTMLLQNPGIKAIYAPWSEPAAGVIQALNTAGRNDVYVGTMDLSNTVALSLAQSGAVRALAIDDPYGIGVAMANEVGLALLGKEVPPYVQVAALSVTRENLLQAYADYYRSDPDPQVVAAVQQ
jgi:ribose transport system substrate-binding protein